MIWYAAAAMTCPLQAHANCVWHVDIQWRENNFGDFEKNVFKISSHLKLVQ